MAEIPLQIMMMILNLTVNNNISSSRIWSKLNVALIMFSPTIKAMLYYFLDWQIPNVGTFVNPWRSFKKKIFLTFTFQVLRLASRSRDRLTRTLQS